MLPVARLGQAQTVYQQPTATHDALNFDGTADKWSDVKEAPDSRPATPQNFECKYCGELVPMSGRKKLT